MQSSQCDALIGRLLESAGNKNQLAHLECIPGRQAEYAELNPPFPVELDLALSRHGIDRLYRHQVEGISCAREGSNVFIVTSTASGKSLIYNGSVIETILNDPESRALYIFPTKALAQDQKRKLDEMGLYPSIKVATYDGDTPQSERRVIRQVAQIVLTNPDMLHVGILPNHVLWSRFLMNLWWVVIDEVHAYAGVLGAHVAHVIRRLRRLCRHYQSKPQFICASATIANPAEAIEGLVGESFRVVDEETGPRGEKRFLLWNPPFLEDTNSAPAAASFPRRRSANREAVELVRRLLEHELRSITFTRARVTAELIVQYLRANLAERLRGRIMVYRAGYLPEQRREIERLLFEGVLLAVASTNALELGVDIGGLDAAVIVGYPGSIASTFQQAGRAGRGEGTSLVILIAQDGPLDQYIIRHPQFLFGRNSEDVVIDPSNVYILAAHLLCAAHELPLGDVDLSFFGTDLDALCEKLEDAGLLMRKDRWYWGGEGRPHDGVSLRSASGKTCEIRDRSRENALMGTVDAERMYVTLHEGAVYLHQGESFRVEELDPIACKATVTPVHSHEYTRPMTVTEISIGEIEREGSLPNGMAIHFGVMIVSWSIVGYRRIQQFTERVLSVHPLDVPPSCFETRGLWFSIDDKDGVSLQQATLGALHAVEHASIAMMPLIATCDPDDVGGVSYDRHPETGLPTIFIYDGYPGGAGFSERAFERIDKLLNATLAMIGDCGCPDGCPSCIQSPQCGNNNEPLDKKGAIRLLQSLTSGSRRV